MKRRKSLIAGITVLAILVLAYGGYNIYRYPAALRRLSDNSLDDLQVEKQREETLSLANRKVLVAYFSYSGTTRNIANAISEKTGGERRIRGLDQLDGWLEELGLNGRAQESRAAEVYEDVEYDVIDGAGHGFHGDAFDEAVRYIFGYLQEIQVI